MKDKNFGWVIQDKNTYKFAGEHERWYGGHCTQTIVCKASVYSTRAIARRAKCDHETVLKISLTKTGKPKAIVGRG